MARALDLLGERWTLLIVRELLCGSRRFGEIQRGIPRISRTMLSARLRELAGASVIESRAGAAGPEYELTAAGHELRLPLVQNQHGSFARDARDLAVNENIGNKIPQYSDPLAAECPDQLREPVHFTCPAKIAFTACNRLSATKCG